jgi:uncharacterized protein YcbK (DUF882 family)
MDHYPCWPIWPFNAFRTVSSLVPILLICLFFLSTPALAVGTGRFFLVGDGSIHIKNMKTGQEAHVTIFAADGSFDETNLAKIDTVFGFPLLEKGEHISLRLICMLDYFSDLIAPGKVINLDSGYRSPQYNSALRNSGGNVAKTSQHIDGMAIDFNIDGVDGRKLWEMIKSRDCCGFGYYGGKDIHLDSARPRFWEASTSKVGSGESDYNRRIYLSTNFDRYQKGEKVRLSLSSVSDFPFGINRTVALVREDLATAATAQLITNGSDCVMIDNRKAARMLYISLPTTLPPGKYRIRMDFCDKPFPQMPSDTLSNVLEIQDSSDRK